MLLKESKEEVLRTPVFLLGKRKESPHILRDKKAIRDIFIIISFYGNFNKINGKKVVLENFRKDYNFESRHHIFLSHKSKSLNLNSEPLGHLKYAHKKSNYTLEMGHIWNSTSEV